MLKTFLGYLKSLKFRIFLLILIFGIVPGQVLRAGVLHTYRQSEADNRKEDITSQLKLLSRQILREDYLADPENSSGSVSALMDQTGSIYDARILVVDKTCKIIKDTYSLSDGKYAVSEYVLKAFQNNEEQSMEDLNLKAGEGAITVAVPISDNTRSSDEVQGVLLAETSLNYMEEGIADIEQWMSVIQLGLIIVVLVLGYIFSVRLVRPLHRLATSIKNVQNGYDADFKRINTYSETEQISSACDDMLSRMQTLDNSRQEFVSNVSHELKTPLTSMKVLADSLVGQENVPIEIYQEFMNDIANEVDRENQIINDLLTLVRLNKDSVSLNISSVNINDMLDLLMKRLRPIAEKQDVELVLESFRPVTAEVDEVKLTLALSNLIENAIKYNKPEGYVHVALNADHKHFFVSVIDNGIGIPEDAQEHIFERFYRVDKSHSRAIGGTGLGLSITRNIIILHHGEIKVHSVLGEGTTFTVRIPLVYIAENE